MKNMGHFREMLSFYTWISLVLIEFIFLTNIYLDYGILTLFNLNILSNSYYVCCTTAKIIIKWLAYSHLLKVLSYSCFYYITKDSYSSQYIFVLSNYIYSSLLLFNAEFDVNGLNYFIFFEFKYTVELSGQVS